MTLNMGFDNEDFDLELDSANTAPERSFTARKRQKNLPTLLPEIAFAKAGRFEVKLVNKQGKETKRYPSELQVVILDSKFGRQQWIAEGGSNKLLCATTSHSIKLRDGEKKEVEGGWWQIPFGDDITNQKYDPIGSKTKDDGTLMSCVECMGAGLNAGCSQRGATYVYLMGMSNEDDEMVLLPKPMLATIKTPKASGIAYQIYIRKELNEKGWRPNQVVTKMGVAPTPNGLANQLTFQMDDKVTDEDLKAATEMLVEQITEWEAEEARKSAERRAKYDKERAAKNANNGGRPAPAGGPKADQAPESAENDDFNF